MADVFRWRCINYLPYRNICDMKWKENHSFVEFIHLTNGWIKIPDLPIESLIIELLSLVPRLAIFLYFTFLIDLDFQLTIKSFQTTYYRVDSCCISFIIFFSSFVLLLLRTSEKDIFFSFFFLLFAFEIHSIWYCNPNEPSTRTSNCGHPFVWEKKLWLSIRSHSTLSNTLIEVHTFDWFNYVLHGIDNDGRPCMCGFKVKTKKRTVAHSEGAT